MQFIVKRDHLLKSLNFVQGIVEKKNTLPILSNVLLQLKDNKLSIVATDLDIIFYDEIKDVQIIEFSMHEQHDLVEHVAQEAGIGGGRHNKLTPPVQGGCAESTQRHKVRRCLGLRGEPQRHANRGSASPACPQ